MISLLIHGADWIKSKSEWGKFVAIHPSFRIFIKTDTYGRPLKAKLWQYIQVGHNPKIKFPSGIQEYAQEKRQWHH